MMKKKLITQILTVLLCMALLVGCATPTVAPTETQGPTTVPTDATTETTEKERVVEEDYVFEGPGIVTLADYPASYKEDATQRGVMEKITYNNGVEEKYFHVYLPYGYDSSNKKYNVLYMMHGGNGRPEIYFQSNNITGYQNVLDNMFQSGYVEPFIVVAPTWNSTVATVEDTEDDHSGSNNLCKKFVQNELAQLVIPLVDEKYRTNANRDGRAFSGFSMGGVTTWYVFQYCMAQFRYFIPLSGDSWIYQEQANTPQGEFTVNALTNAVTSQGYTSEDFLIYCFTGTQDYALPNLAPQIYAMQENDMFKFGDNMFFGTYPDAIHSDVMSRTYLYNALPLIWKD